MPNAVMRIAELFGAARPATPATAAIKACDARQRPPARRARRRLDGGADAAVNGDDGTGDVGARS